jgi:hypothetical protein
MKTNYPKRWTKNLIKEHLELRGYWVAVEGATYSIFQRHNLMHQGTKQDAVLFILDEFKVREAR